MYQSSLSPMHLKSLKSPERSDSTKQTEESIKDQEISFETNSIDDLDHPDSQDIQDHVSLKAQILARTSLEASKMSVVSTLTSRQSIMDPYGQGACTPMSDIKSNECVFSRLSTLKFKELSFMEEFWRSDDEVRETFIQKLKAKKALDSELRGKYQSLILIDWDGGLFCGSDLEEFKSNINSPQSKEAFESLDDAISELLSKFIHLCKTSIVTSYEGNLVESRARMFLPKTYRAIINNKIKIISTNHYFQETSHSHDDTQDKGPLYFKDQFDKNVNPNIMYVVDSNTKIDMLKAILTKQLKTPLIKIVKFKEYSKLKELVKQQRLLIKEIENILFSVRNLTVHLSKKN